MTRIVSSAGQMTKFIPEGKCAPRTRDNLNRTKPHNAGYAGGKILRKRMAKLAARKNAFPAKLGFRLPGSMR